MKPCICTCVMLFWPVKYQRDQLYQDKGTINQWSNCEQLVRYIISHSVVYFQHPGIVQSAH